MLREPTWLHPQNNIRFQLLATHYCVYHHALGWGIHVRIVSCPESKELCQYYVRALNVSLSSSWTQASYIGSLFNENDQKAKHTETLSFELKLFSPPLALFIPHSLPYYPLLFVIGYPFVFFSLTGPYRFYFTFLLYLLLLLLSGMRSLRSGSYGNHSLTMWQRRAPVVTRQRHRTYPWLHRRLLHAPARFKMNYSTLKRQNTTMRTIRIMYYEHRLLLRWSCREQRHGHYYRHGLRWKEVESVTWLLQYT